MRSVRRASPETPGACAANRSITETISRLVRDDQLDDYRQWLDNHRRLRELVAELEDLAADRQVRPNVKT